jgi:hypothetical protein
MGRRLAATMVMVAIGLGMGVAPAAADETAAAATGTITVMLMDPLKQKLPIVNAGIVMTNEFGATRTGLTNPDGQLTLENVPVGSRWSIAATPQLVNGEGRWARLPGVRWGVTVTEGRHDWVVVVLRYGGSVTGGVTTATGEAARNAQVRAVGGWSNKVYTTWTNNSGRYSLGGLPTGDYTITFGTRATGQTTIRRHIDAQYGDKPWSVLTGVDVTLAPAP